MTQTVPADVLSRGTITRYYIVEDVRGRNHRKGADLYFPAPQGRRYISSERGYRIRETLCNSILYIYTALQKEIHVELGYFGGVNSHIYAHSL